MTAAAELNNTAAAAAAVAVTASLAAPGVIQVIMGYAKLPQETTQLQGGTMSPNMSS